MDDRVNDETKLHAQCDKLRDSVNATLVDAPASIRVGVLFACILNTTQNVPCRLWVEVLGGFLHAIAQRDGIFIQSTDLSEDDDDDESLLETLH